MATEITFGGKRIKEPGSYSIIRSGITNPPLSLSYGNVLIIDTGQGAGFGGGSGVNGEIDQNKKSIYSFNRVNDFRNFVGGGFMWMLAEALFRPGGSGVNGISNLFYVRAATTEAAKMTFSPVGGGVNGGEVVIQCLNEGEVGNGVEDTNNELKRGFAFRLVPAENDASKFVMRFYRGTFKGNDSENDPYDFVLEKDAKPELIASSREFSTIDELVSWMNSSGDFRRYFKVSSSTSNGTGLVDADDLTTYSSNTLAAGGTESFTPNDLENALTAVEDLDYTFVLAPDFGSEAQSLDNGVVLAHIETEAKYDKFMIVASRDTEVDYSDSLADANYYDSEKAIVVHGAVNVSAPTATGLKRRGAIYKAAQVLGRIAGLEPQVPGTFKNLNYHSEVHDLTESQRLAALDAGLLVTKFDSELNDFVIVQAINSLQDNDFMVNSDGRSYEVAIERIKAQLNKELVVNSKKQLLGNPDGVNRRTLSAQTIINWTSNYLDRRTATETEDNLILSYQDVEVDVEGDAYRVSYRFEPNFPINKLLFTGFIIDTAS